MNSATATHNYTEKSASPPQRVSQLAGSINSLFELVSALEDKLNPVLRPVPPAPGVIGNSPVAAARQAQCDLADQQDRIFNLREQLQQLLDRVEV